MAESKEMEALNCLNKIQHNFGQLKGKELVNCFETICNALTEYEAIKNAKPNKALECLERIGTWELANSCMETVNESDDYDTIKQALIEVEHNKKLLKIYEQENKNLFDNITTKSNAERCWEIAKHKWVNIAVLIHSKTVDEYNNNAHTPYNLTEEEFNLLKNEVGKCQK